MRTPACFGLPQVEIHLPEFWDPISGPIFPNRGDQDRFWRMTRRFMEQLATSLGSPGGLRVVSARARAALWQWQWGHGGGNVPPLQRCRAVWGRLVMRLTAVVVCT